MDNLNFLQDELKVRGQEKLYEDAHFSLMAYGNAGPIEFVDYKVLGGQNHLLCTSKAFFILKRERILVKHFFESGSSCRGYLFVKNFHANSVDCFPAHTFLMSNGNILIFRYLKSELSFSGSTNLSELHKDDKPSLMAASQWGIAFSVDSQRIYLSKFDLQYHEPCEIYRDQACHVLYFDFMKDNILVCVCKSLFTGELYVEYASFSSSTIKFEPIRRYYLATADASNILVKKLNDIWLVCITVKETWCVMLDRSPFRRQNKGFSKKIHLLNISLDIVRDTLNVYASGNVFETSYLDIINGTGPLKWSFKNIKKLLKLKSETIDFMYGIEGGIYVLASSKSGIQIVDVFQQSTLKAPGCGYYRKTYFDGHPIFNHGSDLDTLLLCGTYDGFNGFFEKQVFQYHYRTVSCQYFSHKPVMDIWLTRKGVFYESMGMVYIGDSASQFDNGIWVSKNGSLISDENRDILFITPVLDPFEDDTDCLLIIREKGDLEIVNVDTEHNFKKIIQFKLGNWLNEASLISATYRSKEEECYVIAYINYHWLNLYCNNALICKIAVSPNFVVADIKILDDAKGLLVIATSFDGKVRIYSVSEKTILLEIGSAFECEMYITDMRGSLLFYNQHEVILVQLKDLTYGSIALPLKPIKIISDDEYHIYVLDDMWRLSLIEISLPQRPISQPIHHDFCGFVPLKMLPVSNTHHMIIVLKGFLQRKIQILLFDYRSMKVLKQSEWTTDCSNVLLEEVWDYAILYYLNGTSPIYQILNGSLELLESGTLPCPASSLSLCLDSRQVSFLGYQTMVYDIILDDDTIHLKPVENTASCAKLSNIYAKESRGKLVSWDQAAKCSQRVEDSEILEDFMTPGGRCSVEICSLSTDHYNNIHVKNLQESVPYLITNVRASPTSYHNIQAGAIRLTNITPVFLVCCSNSALYLIVATTGDENTKKLKN